MRTVGSGDQRQPLSGGDGARVEVYQIETLNPRFHENKGDEHVEEMGAAALSSLYFSPICTSPVRRALEDHLKDREDLLKPQLTYPPLAALDIKAFFRELEWRAATFQQIRPVTSIPVLAAPPIVVPESSPEPEPNQKLPNRPNGHSPRFRPPWNDLPYLVVGQVYLLSLTRNRRKQDGNEPG